jgi:hypothetical protein
MEDSSEDLPKPPRRTAARPFFSPRPHAGEGVTGPLELSRRRSAQLFTPPSSSPAAPRAADPAAEPARPSASSAADGSTDVSADSVPPLATNDLASDDQLVVEQFEPEEIELTASASNVTDEHSIEVIAYDDANSLLKATASDGKHPKVDGLQLETTEFSFEQEPPPPRMNVDSFWANEPFGRMEAPAPEPAADAAALADVSEATIDEETAGEPEFAAGHSASEPSIDDQPIEWADDPSTTISHAQAALEPEPEHDPAPAGRATPMLADIAPPWVSRLTPASSLSLEQLKESEPWDLTPSHGIEAIRAEQQASGQARASAIDENAMARWADVEAPAAHAASVGHDVADALMRIAARVRDGELEVPAEGEMSDEAALSAVLTALLRVRR